MHDRRRLALHCTHTSTAPTREGEKVAVRPSCRLPEATCCVRGGVRGEGAVCKRERVQLSCVF